MKAKRTLRFLVLLLGVQLTACGGGGGGGDPPSAPRSFVHVTASENYDTASRDSTRLNHPLLNGNPNAQILLTANLAPPGHAGAAVINAHPIGLIYDPYVSGTWIVANINGAPMPEGCAFNVRIVAGDAGSFTWTTSASNTTSDFTVISNPLTDANPGALLLTTPNLNLGGWTSSFTSVYMDAPLSLWGIFNQDGSAMPIPSGFNVSVKSADSRNYVHTADSLNITGASTRLSHPLLDGNPHALFQITQNYEANFIYNDYPIAVIYASGFWHIRNTVPSVMGVGAAFNVSID